MLLRKVLRQKILIVSFSRCRLPILQFLILLKHLNLTFTAENIVPADPEDNVTMPEETEKQESDDTVTKTPTPPPATGSFSSLQFRSLQTTPVVGPRSQVINLSNYFPRVASDPPSRKRYHTAPREKHRV